MKQSLLVVQMLMAVFILAGASKTALAQESNSKPAELNVLQRFIGEWKSERANKVTDGEEKRWTEENTFKWVLNGQYAIDMSNENTSELAGMGMWTYDPAKMVYRSRYFTENSSTSVEFIYLWNEETETFTGKGRFSEEVMMNTTIWFSDNNNTYQWTAAVIDKEGKVLEQMQGKHTRVK